MEPLKTDSYIKGQNIDIIWLTVKVDYARIKTKERERERERERESEREKEKAFKEWWGVRETIAILNMTTTDS